MTHAYRLGLLFAGLYAGGLLAHRRDPEMLRIVLNSERYRPRYDPAKAPEQSRTVKLV